MKKVIVPIPGAENVTLFGEHYDVIDGEIEVSDEVADLVLASPDLSNPGRGDKWLVSEVPLDSPDEKPINVGRSKSKK